MSVKRNSRTTHSYSYACDNCGWTFHSDSKKARDLADRLHKKTNCEHNEGSRDANIAYATNIYEQISKQNTCIYKQSGEIVAQQRRQLSRA